MSNENDAALLAATWRSLRELAEGKARETPLLARLLQARVLRHPDLGSAIVEIVATSLADEFVSAAELGDLVRAVMQQHAEIVVAAARDLQAFTARDPSCEDALTALLNYKGFRALECHRVAHALWSAGSRTLARHLQSRMTTVFSIDIHPAACIGQGVFIDHGTAVVIGETAVVDDDVSLLHSVTLGGTGKIGGDRHPKIRKGVMIGAGATVLGNVEVGEGSKIAAGSVVLRPVPPHATVAGVPARVIGHPRELSPSLEMVQDFEMGD